MALTDIQKKALSLAAQSAKECEASTGCPAALTLSQWALESSWGSKSPQNNALGIKPYPGCYGIQFIDTWEVIKGVKVKQRLAFATFKTLADCFRKHAQLITEGRPYANAWNAYQESLEKAFSSFLDSVAHVYATDPDYSSKLKSIISMPDVKEALNNDGFSLDNSQKVS